MKRYILLFAFATLSCNLFGSTPAQLNTAFNGTGHLAIPTTSAYAGVDNSDVTSIAIMPGTGTIVGAGYFTNIPSSNASTAFIQGLNPDGSAAFATNYLYQNITNATGLQGSTFFGVAIQPGDNKIVAVGYLAFSSITYVIVARFLPTGVLDTSFNSLANVGIAPQNAGYTGAPGYYALQPIFGVTTSTNAVGRGIVIQPNGFIVISAENQVTPIGGFLARFTPTGVLDTTFDNGGSQQGVTGILQIGGLNTTIRSAPALQSDGKIVVAGDNPSTDTLSTVLFVARYTAAGLFDNVGLDPVSPFGPSGQGYILPTFPDFQYSSGHQVVIQANDAIVVVGEVNDTTDNGNANYLVARLTENGLGFDTTFNGTGYSINADGQFHVSRYGTVAQAVAMQPNQQIVTSGYGYFDSVLNGVILRYNQDGTVDSSFAEQSDQTVANITFSAALAIANNGNVFVGGLYQTPLTSSFIDSLYYVSVLGGQTPSTVPATSSIGAYGYNSAFIGEFLYTDFYATVITNLTVQAAAIADVNDIIATYAANYANQPNFNYISYLYLINDDLAAAQASLIALYPGSTSQINQFFLYLQERIAILAA